MASRNQAAVLNFADDLRDLTKPNDMLALLDATLRPMGLFLIAVYWTPPDYTNGNYYRLGQCWWVCRNGTLKDEFWKRFGVLVRQRGPSVLTRYAKAKKRPFTFREARQVMKPDAKQNWVFDFYAEYKVSDGYIYPDPKGWIVAIGSHKVLRLNDAECANLSYVSQRIIDRIERVAPVAAPKEVLSARQYMVLEYGQQGDSDKEIAEKLGMNERTVREHRERGRKKLNARNTAHAMFLLQYHPAPMLSKKKSVE